MHCITRQAGHAAGGDAVEDVGQHGGTHVCVVVCPLLVEARLCESGLRGRCQPK